MSAVISVHPSSFCVFETLRAFFLFGGIYCCTLPQNVGGEEQSSGNRGKGTGNTCSPLCSWNMFPEHFGENPSIWESGQKIESATGVKPTLISGLFFWTPHRVRGIFTGKIKVEWEARGGHFSGAESVEISIQVSCEIARSWFLMRHVLINNFLIWGCLLKIHLSKRSKKQYNWKTPSSQLSSSPDA